LGGVEEKRTEGDRGNGEDQGAEGRAGVVFGFEMGF